MNFNFFSRFLRFNFTHTWSKNEKPIQPISIEKHTRFWKQHPKKIIVASCYCGVVLFNDIIIWCCCHDMQNFALFFSVKSGTKLHFLKGRSDLSISWYFFSCFCISQIQTFSIYLIFMFVCFVATDFNHWFHYRRERWAPYSYEFEYISRGYGKAASRQTNSETAKILLYVFRH